MLFKRVLRGLGALGWGWELPLVGWTAKIDCRASAALLTGRAGDVLLKAQRLPSLSFSFIYFLFLLHAVAFTGSWLYKQHKGHTPSMS